MNTVLVDRPSIVSAARAYLDTPYLHQGRMKGCGVDCAGLLMCVAYDLKIRDVRVSDYGRQPDSARARSIIEQHMERVRFADIAPGDVLSFAIANDVQHYGILTEINPHRFIHAYQTVGKVVEQSLVGPWVRRLRGCYRFPEAVPWLPDA